MCAGQSWDLPDDYSMIATLLETSSDELFIPDATAKLQTVEQSVKQHIERVPEKAYAARQPHSNHAAECWYCKKTSSEEA